MTKHDFPNKTKEHDFRFQQVTVLADKILAYAGDITESQWKQTRQTIFSGLDRLDPSTLHQLLKALVNQLVFMGELPLTVASEDYDINDHFDGWSADDMQKEIAAQILAQEARLERLKRLIAR